MSSGNTLSALANLLDRSREPTPLDEAYERYHTALRYAVIDAGFVGDDEDAKVISSYVSIVRTLRGNFDGHASIKISKSFTDPITNVLAAGEEFLNAVEALAVVRCSALGIDLQEVYSSVEKPALIKQEDERRDAEVSAFPTIIGTPGMAG